MQEVMRDSSSVVEVIWREERREGYVRVLGEAVSAGRNGEARLRRESWRSFRVCASLREGRLGVPAYVRGCGAMETRICTLVFIVGAPAEYLEESEVSLGVCWGI